MDDVLNYKSYLEEKNAQTRKADAVVLKMKAALVGFRNLHYQHSEHNQSRALWEKINQMNSDQSRSKRFFWMSLLPSNDPWKFSRALLRNLRQAKMRICWLPDLGKLNQKLRDLSVLVT